MLSNIMNLVMDAVRVIGAALIVWGAVQFGLALKDKSGADMAGAVGWIVGGAIIIVAAALFGQIDFGSLSGV